MDSEDHVLRAELEIACANVRRQIDLQLRSQRTTYGGPGDRLVMKALQDELDQLEECLANLTPRGIDPEPPAP